MTHVATAYPSVLLVEDSPADAILITKQLNSVWPSASVRVVDSLAKTYDVYRTMKVDLVLLDLNLPDGFGSRSVEEVMAFIRNVPLLVITGMGTQMTTNDSIRYGAKHVVQKSEIMTDKFKKILTETLVK